MAFIVEDGTIVADANAYVSVEYYDAYLAERGRIDNGDTPAKQGQIIQATDYMETMFGRRYAGEMLGATLDPTQDQSLSFPRVNIPGQADGMPDTLLKACCEYAIRAKLAPLMPDPVVDPTGYSVVITSRKVGPLERKFEVVNGTTRPGSRRSYPAADILMIPLLDVCYAGNRVYR